MTIHPTRWTAASTAALALAGLGGGIAAAATSTPASPAARTSSALTAKLLAVTPAKGQASPGKHATGSFSGTLRKNDKVTYRITFSGLSAPVTGAMLQFGTPTKASTKSLAIAITSGLSPAKGTLTLTGKEAASVRAGKAWISLQTKKDVTGAIRGRIAA
jgi:CHRD domain-containing protein